MNREQWLTDALPKLAEIFTEQGAAVPENVRVSCSWPSKSIRKRIGEAWTTDASAGGFAETFISPVMDDPATVLGVLTHELVHHAVGVEHGHKKPFRDLAIKVGLEGKMTSAHPGERLSERLNAIASELGEYPHGKLDPGSGSKKQGTRLIKCHCPDCGYTVRTTAKWLEMYGAPICPCSSEAMEVG